MRKTPQLFDRCLEHADRVACAQRMSFRTRACGRRRCPTSFLKVAFYPGASIHIVKNHRRSSTNNLEAAIPLAWMGLTTGKADNPPGGILNAGSSPKRLKVGGKLLLGCKLWTNSRVCLASASLNRSMLWCNNSLVEFICKHLALASLDRRSIKIVSSVITCRKSS